MRNKQRRIGFGQALAVLAGLAAFASASEWGSGGMFARWSRGDEVTSLRTANSKTFDNHDGTRSVVIAEPMHRQVRPGVWADPPDTTVRVDTGEVDDDGMWYSPFEFFCCQHIYLASELNFAGTIGAIAFYADDPCPPETMVRSHQFLRNAAETCLTSHQWCNAGTEVWTGDLIRDGIGWLTLPLQVRFFHGRDSSLVVSYRHVDSTNHLRAYRRYHGTRYDSAGCRSERACSWDDTLPLMFPSQTRVNIMITYTPALVDVQTSAILSPVDSVLWGHPCIPKAVVRNNGVAPVSFPVRFDIGGIYHDTFAVTNLQPGTQDTVSFATWTPDSAGPFSVKCSTRLVGDQHTENDRLVDSVFVVCHDVGLERVIAPTGTIAQGDSVLPSLLLRNWGTEPENAWGCVAVTRAGGLVYADSIRQSVGAGESVAASLPHYWLADSVGDYHVQAWTSLPGDMNPANDTTRGDFSVRFLPLHDVGLTAILEPRDSIVQDSLLQPRAIVHNFGRSDEIVPIRFSVLSCDTLVYGDEVELPLAAGESAVVSNFRPWRAGQTGWHRVVGRTLLLADQDSTNDAMSDSFLVVRRVRHNVGIIAIIDPAGLIDTGTSVVPLARIRNLGDFQESGTAFLTISGSPAYGCSVRVTALAPDTTRDVAFPSWTARHPGGHIVRCSLHFAADGNRADDTLSSTFEVQEPTPWRRVADLPEGPRHKRARAGAALASDGGSLVYALKGNRTREFYAYQVSENSWVARCSVPGRHARRASALCYAPGIGRVYAARAGSCEFWSYRPDDNTWHQRAGIPLGISSRKPGPGLALATMDTGRIYLLKGGTREFLGYDPPHDTWLTLADAPAGVSGKCYRAGSCMVAVRDYLYLLKGGQNEFFAYSTLDDTWYSRTALPKTGRSGSPKRARAGTAITHNHDVIYALKGRSGDELWWYDTFGDSWAELRGLPAGPGLRPAGDGGALAFAVDRLLCLKGNNTCEFWSYDPQTSERSSLGASRAKEIHGLSAFITPQLTVRVTPNPFTRSARIEYSMPVPGRVSLKLYDVCGRLVHSFSWDRQPAGYGSVEVGHELQPGIYLLRLSNQTNTAATEIIRQ